MKKKPCLYYYKYIFIIFISALFISCSITKCPDNLITGNLGKNVNSPEDDYLPKIYENYLYFSSKRDGDVENIYKSKIRRKSEYSTAVIDTKLPLYSLTNYGSIDFFINIENNTRELYFAATQLKNKSDRNIYYSSLIDNKWSIPMELSDAVNSEFYESHPAIAPDGSFMVFTSDRPKGFGETDLYISIKNSDGSWTSAKNLGKPINTESPEITPFIGPDFTLYYSTKAYSKNDNFDIAKAKYLGAGKWDKPQVMRGPINTSADEIGPMIYDDMIYLSSNRKGGCGCYDLYEFDLCGPVLITGDIITGGLEIKPEGTVELLNTNNQILATLAVNNTGKYEVEVPPKMNYILKYTNKCLSEFVQTQPIAIACSDSSVLKYIVNFNLPDNLRIFTTEKYNVPFFVSGYYFPNTKENLNTLRMRFQYGLIGSDDSTKYIENPGPEYDIFADSVNKALDEAVDFILSRLAFLSISCTEGKEKLTIKVTGYADPRPLSNNAKYNGLDIEDPLNRINIQRGESMTNEILSTLRAYYTSKFLQTYLSKFSKYLENSNKIEWFLEGKGIDNSDAMPNELKRKVKIEIGVRKVEG